jgi:hypothetical protein
MAQCQLISAPSRVIPQLRAHGGKASFKAFFRLLKSTVWSVLAAKPTTGMVTLFGLGPSNSKTVG